MLDAVGRNVCINAAPLVDMTIEERLRWSDKLVCWLLLSLLISFVYFDLLTINVNLVTELTQPSLIYLVIATVEQEFVNRRIVFLFCYGFSAVLFLT